MPNNSNSIPPWCAVILAAGQGTRMKSALPKVLHELSGQPMIFHILDRLIEVSPQVPICVVVGHQHEQVETAIKNHCKFGSADISFVHQSEQLGTGHAAQTAMNSKWGESQAASKRAVLVLPGDAPLIPKNLVEQVVDHWMGRSSVARLITCNIAEPKGYGRIVRRGKKGPVLRIVEEKDANSREKEIQEINTGIYLFHSVFLKAGLSKLSNKNAQKEYYLTDLISQAARAKKGVEVLQWEGSSEDVFGINDHWQLAHARNILNQRILKHWAIQGVKFVDIRTIGVDSSVELAEGVEVHPGVLLKGKTRIGKNSIIGPNSVLTHTRVGENTEVFVGTVSENAEIGNDCKVGPYARIRPESKISDRSKIGNFVELKKANIGSDTSIAHLSYVGDAEVGAHVNIGCGFVTCNFDGRVIDGNRKHKTIIGDHVFLGSDCQAIAPVKIESGSYIASGSTITDDVPSDSFAIARSRQVTKPGYARKLKGTP